MATLIPSKQRDVPFLFIASPITIDKRNEWGDSADNFQQAPNGAFLKVDTADPTRVTHLVQPKNGFSAPIGWVPGSAPGLFDKEPIFVGDVLQPGEMRSIVTKDGPIEYTAKELSIVCYNANTDGSPDESDSWVQTVAAVAKNYEFTLADA